MSENITGNKNIRKFGLICLSFSFACIPVILIIVLILLTVSMPFMSTLPKIAENIVGFIGIIFALIVGIGSFKIIYRRMKKAFQVE